jgi:hypothetical protein
VLRAAAVAAALVVTATAGAVTPAQGLAKQLKTSMQSYYAKSDPGLKFTTVTCKISSNRTTARCNAHFTVAAKHAAGVFVVAITGAGGGQVQTKTLSVTCTDTRTGKKRSC